MIRLKLKNNPIVSGDPIYGSQLQPYLDKILEGLHKTQVKSELVIPIEQAIRTKTRKDLEMSEKDVQFDIFKTMYVGNARHIIENLKIGNQINNVDLIEKVNQGTISPEVLVNLTPQDMHSERWMTLIEKKIVDLDKLTKNPEATTNLYTCSRCKNNQCTYFERQDRSADEPMTTHITCCTCGKKWRI